MSTGVSDYQKNKTQGNSVPNGPKDHHNEREDLDSWRSHQQHHQAYSTPSSDPYMSYYGAASFQYQPPFGVSDSTGLSGPWSTNGGEMGFLSGGYSAPHEHPHTGGMFGGGGSGGFANVGGQQFSYGYGNGDYNTWGQPRKPYDDYYRDGMYADERGMKMMEHGMGGLSLSDKEHKEMMSGKKTTTWASIASQPAKTQSLMKKKAGMPPPPIMLSNWDTKNGTVAKAPIAAPVQAPRPPAWERMERPPNMPPPSGPSALPHPSSSVPTGPVGPLMGNNAPGRGGFQQHHQQMGYMPPLSQSHPPPPMNRDNRESQSHSHGISQSNNHANHASSGSNSRSSVEPKPTSQAIQPQYPDEAKMKSEYNPATFDLNPENARFFVIKSYSEDDIHRSIKYEIWCSTDHGNKRLDQSFREREGKGPIYLLFSVNSSGHFCGMAQMMSEVDYDSSSSVWSQNKWKGQFKVKWIYVKDVPNSALRHIRLENNENKPVTNSRDTQEVPYDKGLQVLKIIHSFPHTTSIFDDFVHYEKRQEEEDQRRTTAPPNSSSHKQANSNSDRDQHERGGHQGRGSHHSNNNYGNDFQHRDNPRDHRDRDHDGGRSGPYFGNGSRGEHRGGSNMGRGSGFGGMSRGGGGGDRDRGFDSHIRDRDRDHFSSRGGSSRGRGGFRS